MIIDKNEIFTIDSHAPKTTAFLELSTAKRAQAAISISKLFKLRMSSAIPETGLDQVDPYLTYGTRTTRFVL